MRPCVVIFILVGLCVGEGQRLTPKRTHVGLPVDIDSMEYRLDYVEGPPFDGVGAISSDSSGRVLRAYPAPQQREILDYLFKPGFGASIQVLKVEIGGDALISASASPSHMHTPWDENYRRGYEWWLMVEAKKRNPFIKFYAVPWAFPAWVGCRTSSGDRRNCTMSPYAEPKQTAAYVVRWLLAAKYIYSIDVNFVGMWNQGPWDEKYLRVLRAELDKAGLNRSIIAAPDGDAWAFAAAMTAQRSTIFRDGTVRVLAQHYPRSMSTPTARRTGAQLWSTEDGDVYNDNTGAGCVARTLVRNFVDGSISSTYIRSLVTAFPAGTGQFGAGIVTALSPYADHPVYGSFSEDGNWTPGQLLWSLAHTTQFTAGDSPHSWKFLDACPHQSLGVSCRGGSGHLLGNGSFVTYVNPDTCQFSMVIETLTLESSACLRPNAAPRVPIAGQQQQQVGTQNATFRLDPKLLGWVKTAMPKDRALGLTVVFSSFATGQRSPRSTVFSRSFIPVCATTGKFTVLLEPDTVMTLTTQHWAGHRGVVVPPVLKRQTVLRSFHEDFQTCSRSSESPLLADQVGVWECHVAPPIPLSSRNRENIAIRQMIGEMPMRSPDTDVSTVQFRVRGFRKVWPQVPHTFIGDADAANSSLTVKALISNMSEGIFIGARCRGQEKPLGFFFGVNASTRDVGLDVPSRFFFFLNVSDIGRTDPFVSGETVGVEVFRREWNSYRLDVNGSFIRAYINGQMQFELMLSRFIHMHSMYTGFNILGVNSFGQSHHIDDVQLYIAKLAACSVGSQSPRYGPLHLVECASIFGKNPTLHFVFSGDAHTKTPGLIRSTGGWNLCVSLGSMRNMQQNETTLSILPCETAGLWTRRIDPVAGYSSFSDPTGVFCIDGTDYPTVGTRVLGRRCSNAPSQQFLLDVETSEIVSPASGKCIGQCAE